MISYVAWPRPEVGHPLEWAGVPFSNPSGRPRAAGLLQLDLLREVATRVRSVVPYDGGAWLTTEGAVPSGSIWSLLSCWAGIVASVSSSGLSALSGSRVAHRLAHRRGGRPRSTRASVRGSAPDAAATERCERREQRFRPGRTPDRRTRRTPLQYRRLFGPMRTCDAAHWTARRMTLRTALPSESHPRRPAGHRRARGSPSSGSGYPVSARRDNHRDAQPPCPRAARRSMSTNQPTVDVGGLTPLSLSGA